MTTVPVKVRVEIRVIVIADDGFNCAETAHKALGEVRAAIGPYRLAYRHNAGPVSDILNTWAARNHADVYQYSHVDKGQRAAFTCHNRMTHDGAIVAIVLRTRGASEPLVRHGIASLKHRHIPYREWTTPPPSEPPAPPARPTAPPCCQCNTDGCADALCGPCHACAGTCKPARCCTTDTHLDQWLTHGRQL